MSLWRYRAVALAGQGGAVQRGEMSAGTAAEVRASLRRLGLQPVEVRPLAQSAAPLRQALDARLATVLRRRRGSAVAELLDGFATLLDSGTPLLEALQTLERSDAGGTRRRRLAARLAEGLRSGNALAESMAAEPAWFSPVEVAVVRAAEHSGTLPGTLWRLSEKRQEAEDLSHRFVGVLAYPAIVTAVGVGVWVFLSRETLPKLAKILEDSDVPVPVLTARVTALGRWVASDGWIVAIVMVVATVATAVALRKAPEGSLPARVRGRLEPRVLRRLAVAEFSGKLAELLRAGVPAVEALRVLAPTARSSRLRQQLSAAAARVERGEDLHGALDDPVYFDAEFRRLVEVGERAGELEAMLGRVHERTTRQTRRLIERLSALVEPAVILGLAFAIGLVVLAAVLPIVRLQEVLQ